MRSEQRSWLRTVVLSVTIGFLGGVGVLSMTLTADVREHGTLINRITKDLDEEKDRTEKRISEVAAAIRESNQLVKASIEGASKLVATIEAQNKLIISQNETIQAIRNKP